MVRGTLSIFDLERMILDRQRELTKLERQRSKWQKRIDDLDRKISALGGSVSRRTGGRRGPRARNEVSLPDAIAGVLSRSRGPVAVADVVEGVLGSGYRTSSANFRAVVNQALIKDGRFASAGRGLYQMKGGADGATSTAARRSTPRRPSQRKKSPAKAAVD